MIGDYVTSMNSILKIEDADDYPYLDEILKPTAEQVIRDAVGEAWVTAHENNPTVVQVYCILVATWFTSPEAFGELTPGANFLLSQLQAKALNYTPEEAGT